MQPYYQKNGFTLYHGDLHDVLPTLPEKNVDFVVTDPPYLMNFMDKEWDKAGKGDIPTNELVFRSWFAGIVAGEAYFRIHRERDGAYYACEFGIKMRADEGPLLRALARRTSAGKVHDIPPESRVVNSGPAAKWVVQSREDCWKIARLLDGTPLYGKKQREYDLWRRALKVWTDAPRGNRWHGPRDNAAMEALWKEMRTLRPFDQELADSHFDPLGQPDYLFHYRWAKACLRVVKPGGLLLAFGGTRTWHRLVGAIEDAGWEIRDSLMWLYGQGFPKSLDISKALRKAGNVETLDSIPAAEFAKHWNGWGSSLKPAWEPIVLAMKPLDGTFAQNARRHGVAGMNIDGCRIPCDYAAEYGEKWLSSGKGKAGPWHATEYEETRSVAERVSPLGRWPANLLLEHHPECRQVGTTTLRGDPRGNCAGRRPGGFGNVGADSGDGEPNARVYGNEVVPAYECHPDCPVRGLDAQTGTLTSGKMKAGQQRNRSKGEGGYHGDFPDTASATGTYGDSGGASRFFYCGKATKKERGPGNDHPTVKPLDLMGYLLTLLSTPTGGVILDPFAGSGTTLIAAKRLGRPCIGVELDAHNCDIAVARLES